MTQQRESFDLGFGARFAIARSVIFIKSVSLPSLQALIIFFWNQENLPSSDLLGSDLSEGGDRSRFNFLCEGKPCLG